MNLETEISRGTKLKCTICIHCSSNNTQGSHHALKRGHLFPIASTLGERCEEVEVQAQTTSDFIDCFDAEQIGSALQGLFNQSGDGNEDIFDWKSDDPFWLGKF